MQPSVLIVEDNPVTRKVLRLTLEGEGYRVWEADGAWEALKTAQACHPSLIVQDLMLPDMEGFELIKHLRALQGIGDIPILCYSGLIGPDERQHVIDSGFTDLVLKPSAPAEMAKIVRSYIESRTNTAPGAFIGRHILVVDDDPALRKLSTLRLQAAGARVTTAQNGNDALAKVRAELPDAILSDVLMPECDGFALCLALRSDPALAPIPLVLMSSQYVNKEDLELAQQLGANALVGRSADMSAALVALTESLTEFAPVLAADPSHLAATHLERVMHQLQHQVHEQTHSAQAYTLYNILAGFLEQVAQVQAHGGDLAAKLDEVLAHYLNACGYPTGAMYLFEADGELTPHALCGVAKTNAEAWLDFFHQPALLCQAMARDVPTAFSNDNPEARELLLAAEAETMMLCPLQIDNRPLGIMVLCSKRRQLDSEWLALAQAAARPISQTIAFARTLTALSASEQRFRSVAESLGDGIVITDERSKIIYVNAAVETLFGHPADSLLGWDDARLTPLLGSNAGVWAGSVTHRDGRQISVTGSTAVVTHSERPDRLTYTHVIHDLSAQERMEQWQHLANHDALTQVYNRRAFEHELKTRLSEAKRYGVQGAVLTLDIDHFKQFNDKLGHAAGDVALVTFSQVLRNSVRDTDVLARLGGDEFAIIAPYATAAQAQAFADKLLQQMSANPTSYNGEPIHFSISIGIALYNQQMTSPEALLAGADAALCQAKQAGRGCYRLYRQDNDHKATWARK